MYFVKICNDYAQNIKVFGNYADKGNIQNKELKRDFSESLSILDL